MADPQNGRERGKGWACGYGDNGCSWQQGKGEVGRGGKGMEEGQVVEKGRDCDGSKMVGGKGSKRRRGRERGKRPFKVGGVDLDERRGGQRFSNIRGTENRKKKKKKKEERKKNRKKIMTTMVLKVAMAVLMLKVVGHSEDITVDKIWHNANPHIDSDSDS
ncbi:hypothetical protein Ancab_016150 [Ancistrocladus abbreviatus]